MRNPYRDSDTGVDSLKVTGYYYVNSLNASGYGFVEFDTETYWPSYIKSRVPDTTSFIFKPRVLHYYPGDGMEYLFREHTAPYGIHDKSAFIIAQYAAPTIFYLEEIRSGEQIVTTFQRSRHYPTETNVDTTVGRALLTEFSGHRISYNNAYITIEALGRTFTARYKSSWSYYGGYDNNVTADLLYPIGLLQATGSIRGWDQQWWMGGGAHTYDNGYSTLGMITDIIDPQGRSLKFGYEGLDRIHEDFEYPRSTSGDLKLRYYRLNRITTNAGYTTIVYHRGDSTGTVQKDSVKYYGSSKLIYNFHHIAGEVDAYNSANILLGRTTYTFDNNPSGYNRKTTIISSDSIAGMQDTVENYYGFQTLLPYVGDISIPTYSSLSITPLEKTIKRSIHGLTKTITTYQGDTLTGTRYLYLPIEKKSWFRPADTAVDILIKRTTMGYTFDTVRQYGGNTALAGMLGLGIATRSVTDYMPDSPSDTIAQVFTTYLHLPETTASVTRIDTVWNEHRSRFVTDSLRALGMDTTAIIYTTNSISGVTVIVPPLENLTRTIFVRKGADTIAGAKYGYQTSMSSSIPRGAMIADTIRGGNDEIITGASTDFSGGWYRNFAIGGTDIFGARGEVMYAYPSGSVSGTRLDNLTGTTSAKLYERHNEYESALGMRAMVRKADTVGIIQRDTVQSFVELGFGGNPIGMIDPEGYYAASRYDLAGRPLMSWAPGDFPVAWERRPDRLKLYDVATVHFSRPDTLDCSDTSCRVGAWVVDSVEPYKLYCYGEEVGLSCASSVLTGKSIKDKGRIIYTSQPNDNIKAGGAGITDIDLAMTVTTLHLESEVGVFNQPIDISIPRWSYHTTYVFTNSYDPATDSLPLTMKEFRITLPKQVRDSLQAMSAGDTISIWIEPGAASDRQEFEILAIADDRAPAFIVTNGSYADASADFTSAATYDDTLLTTTGYGKIDDPLTTENPNWSASSGKQGRVTGGRGEYAAAANTRRSVVFIGDAYSPSRTDTVSARLSGSGLTLSARDAAGYTTMMGYQVQHKADTLIHADSEKAYRTAVIDREGKFGLGSDQDFHGVVAATFLTDERGIVSASYADVFGRVRRTVVDTGGLKLTTRSEYDDMGKLRRMISPSGDTTKYWYDNFGRLRAAEQPDVGLTSYRYDKRGSVRFTQTASQRDSSKLTFYEHDDAGRLTLVGEAKVNPGLVVAPNYSDAYPEPTPAWYLTDVLSPDIVNVTGYALPITTNSTLWSTPSSAPPTIPCTSDTTRCLPLANFPLKYEPDTLRGPYLKRAAGLWEPVVAPNSANGNFENVGTYPENIRRVMSYDRLPFVKGGVWAGFPAAAAWDSIAPTGKVRHLQGALAAVAYRQTNGQPYHYEVYSYNERGRLEAVLRLTENVGFDAVYYRYNATGAPIQIQTLDPFNRHSTWYSYDANGRPDSVYSTLSENDGLGWTSPRRPLLSLARPSSPDVAISYSQRGLVDTVQYFTSAGTIVRTATYDARARLDTSKAMLGATDVFSQSFVYDPASNIVHRAETNGFRSFAYDGAGRMTAENDGTTATDYYFDAVNNRRGVREGGSPRDTLRYTGNRLTQLERLTDTTTYTRNRDGAVTGRTTYDLDVQATPTRQETFFYDFTGLTIGYTKKLSSGASGCLPYPPTVSLDSTDNWRYRHGVAGAREQKRMYYSPSGDSCNKIHQWVYYLLGAGGEERAVWHGRQTADADSCSGAIRRVILYPVEYLSAGGAYYTRDNSGRWRKEFRVGDHLGSVRAIVRGGVVTNFDYDAFGTFAQQTERWSYLGREKESENSTSEFGFRKYDEETGSFMQPDPLWASFPSQSPYQYGYNSPLNFRDAGGLFGETVGGGGGSSLGDIDDLEHDPDCPISIGPWKGPCTCHAAEIASSQAGREAGWAAAARDFFATAGPPQHSAPGINGGGGGSGGSGIPMMPLQDRITLIGATPQQSQIFWDGINNDLGESYFDDFGEDPRQVLVFILPGEDIAKIENKGNTTLNGLFKPNGNQLLVFLNSDMFSAPSILTYESEVGFPILDPYMGSGHELGHAMDYVTKARQGKSQDEIENLAIARVNVARQRNGDPLEVLHKTESLWTYVTAVGVIVGIVIGVLLVIPSLFPVKK